MIPLKMMVMRTGTICEVTITNYSMIIWTCMFCMFFCHNTIKVVCSPLKQPFFPSFLTLSQSGRACKYICFCPPRTFFSFTSLSCCLAASRGRLGTHTSGTTYRTFKSTFGTVLPQFYPPHYQAYNIEISEALSSSPFPKSTQVLCWPAQDSWDLAFLKAVSLCSYIY